ncbi:hypothetical protein DI09_164p50 [Mitosporidium daphniae]|uniref:Uncharacterized protein n=1 Tax=Mitosporidium daphniae TaxID=1485682 RepID=A0A098VUJ5_9MICR|nr:uncharacterized protein DI09_79p150 [Mitosporidium daphniae]XP_013238950.1 uncharacterized protein DI09_164p50 [Mitosporidium daphniae]KGG50292.1 hypothetical protein DI09_79p150 [Mitosporidium daphniae]KGG52514.1 hypothetical protein DI09_164p50 [Mitosporidium daphniae]|eukprot:XP_013236719.1 uncharacterized protein DI09_79p150 [Mitosporidium daphniae]
MDVEQISNQALPLSAMKETKTTVPGWISFVSGGVGGICLVLVGHPFDLVKVRLQAGIHQYGSMGNAFNSIVTKDGILGLYRGMLAPIIGVTPIFAVSFWGYAFGMKMVTSFNGDPQTKPTLGQISLAGAFSALPTTALMVPFERLKVMAQIQEGTAYKGPGSILISMLRTKGVGNSLKMLYRGTMATLARDAPGSVAYFATYEILKKKLSSSSSSSSSSLPVASILVAGGLAGMANWLVAIPADVIKSRIQAGSEESGTQLLKGMLQKEGPRALFKGLGPALLRAFPANAACFAGVEISTSMFKKIALEN